MPDIDVTDREQLEAWLNTQPREVAVLIAARAALRVVPALAPIFRPFRSDRRAAAKLIMPVLRGLSATWAAGAWPRANLGPAIDRAAELVGVGNNFREHEITATTKDILASAYYANVAADPSTRVGSNLVVLTVQAAEAATKRSVASTGMNSATEFALRSDVKAVAAGNSLVTLPLWINVARLLDNYGPVVRRGNMPEWERSQWTALSANLRRLEDKWDVWTDWYEARLRGDPADEALEVARVLIPDEVWNQGPKVLNAEIKRLIEEHSVRPPPPDPLPSDEPSEHAWAEQLAAVEQSPLGARFEPSGDHLFINASGDETDVAAATDPLTQQLHEDVKRKAPKASAAVMPLDNQPGWGGIGTSARRFNELTQCPTSEIPGRIGAVYGAVIELGSFLELNRQLKTNPAANASPLEPEVERVLSDLIRTAAPWVRRFPTARTLDDETGAFLTDQALFRPAEAAVDSARAALLITPEDAALLKALIEAAHRGEFQGRKAGARGLLSSRNLVLGAASALSAFAIGAVSSDFAPKSVLAQRAAGFALSCEAEILELFADAPDDLRLALADMLKEIRRGGDLPPLPSSPRVPVEGTEAPSRSRKG